MWQAETMLRCMLAGGLWQDYKEQVELFIEPEGGLESQPAGSQGEGHTVLLPLVVDIVRAAGPDKKSTSTRMAERQLEVDGGSDLDRMEGFGTN